jgi:hypothetical protein
MSSPRSFIMNVLAALFAHELLTVRAEAQSITFFAFAAQNDSQVGVLCGMAFPRYDLVDRDIACLTEN